MTAMIGPPAEIGILGCGQLGRMLAMAARRMGYRVAVLADDTNSPAGQFADREIVVDNYAAVDERLLGEFADSVRVLTYEFENIPLPVAKCCEQTDTPVFPSSHVLETAQNRVLEKTRLSEAGLPVTPFRAVKSVAECHAAWAELGPETILKTATGGYDGHGQAGVNADEEVAVAWEKTGGDREKVLEKKIAFEAELSVIGARNAVGESEFFGPIRNDHRNHILDLSVLPGGFAPAIEKLAIDITRGAMESLDLVGLLCVEFFLSPGGELLINEIAPRPHNSGHLTIEACATSQFEQHVRAVCGLPLGDTNVRRPAAMANLLGKHLPHSLGAFSEALRIPDVAYHDYGKMPRADSAKEANRKRGHLTVLAKTPELAEARARESRCRLNPQENRD